MNFEHLLIDNNDGIITVTVNRPKALNALNRQVFTDLKNCFEQYKGDASVKGIIVTGAGEKAFVAGADIKEFDGLDAEKGQALSKRGQDIFLQIEEFDKPVIAVVNGFALGGGCELAMACHFRIAEENARFGQPEVNLGIIPGYAGTQRLVRYMGKGKALELLLTADMIDAQTALRYDLVNYVLPKGEGIPKAQKIIAKIATKAPIAVSETIKLVNDYYKSDADGFAGESEAFGRICDTEDFKEGAAAFVEKRKANFKGK